MYPNSEVVMGRQEGRDKKVEVKGREAWVGQVRAKRGALREEMWKPKVKEERRR